MAKKNKKKRSSLERNVPPLPASKPTAKAPAAKPAAANHQATRETVEALVIALVLAFLFRTFQAEAFVIPTGSMAPTLMGMHKDVYCDQCGQRFKVNASEEGKTPQELWVHGVYRDYRTAGETLYQAQTLAGNCQNCRYPMPFRPDLPRSIPEAEANVAFHNTSSGDRILVNKYLYSFTDPRRWDVVVFKYPGDAKQNYIKRLVGLPGETLRLYQGDVYTNASGDFEILRKPADKVLAMRQLVHDTNHDPAALFQAGWPLRWLESPGCEVETSIEGKKVRQTYRLSSSGNEPVWLHYVHTPATPAAWRIVRDRLSDGASLTGALESEDVAPGLITDFNSYNTEVQRWRLTELQKHGRQGDIERAPDAEGIHWASDLSVDVDLTVESNEGALLLDLVEAGQHFVCEIDLATGEASLRVLANETLEPVLEVAKVQTPLKGRGGHTVRFANVDDQLILWVNGSQVKFDGAYDARNAFGQAENLAPKTSDDDAGDLAPVAVGVRNANVSIGRLQVFRDLYYIAARWNGIRRPVSDYALVPSNGFGVSTPSGATGRVWEVAKQPTLWPAIADRRAEDFEITEGQYFVMGDNSSSSKDCRLWTSNDGDGRPGGLYLEENLLTGKAVCVYWPHALVSIPTPKRGVRIPVVPNLGDIRLVR